MSITYLQREEVEQLLREIPLERDRLLVRALYETGCSIAEIASLKSHAVHADGTVSFPGRTARISSELAEQLLAQAKQTIFFTRQGSAITPKRIQQILKPHLLALSKQKPTPHVLRYSHVIHAYKQGIALAAISEQTGIGTQRLAQIVNDVKTPKAYSNFFTVRGKQ